MLFESTNIVHVAESEWRNKRTLKLGHKSQHARLRSLKNAFPIIFITMRYYWAIKKFNRKLFCVCGVVDGIFLFFYFSCLKYRFFDKFDCITIRKNIQQDLKEFRENLRRKKAINFDLIICYWFFCMIYIGLASILLPFIIYFIYISCTLRPVVVIGDINVELRVGVRSRYVREVWKNFHLNDFSITRSYLCDYCRLIIIKCWLFLHLIWLFMEICSSYLTYLTLKCV